MLVVMLIVNVANRVRLKRSELVWTALQATSFPGFSWYGFASQGAMTMFPIFKPWSNLSQYKLYNTCMHDVNGLLGEPNFALDKF